MADKGENLWGEPTALRKPVGVGLWETAFIVVCDDGSVWLRRHGEWVEDTPIPGTLRADATGSRQ